MSVDDKVRKSELLSELLAFLKAEQGEVKPQGPSADNASDLLTAVSLEYCAVYLRPECTDCAINHLIEHNNEFMTMMLREHRDLGMEPSIENRNQYNRHFVIWAREKLDTWVKEPCSATRLYMDE